MARFDEVLLEGVRLFRMGYFAIPCRQYEKHPCFVGWNTLKAESVDEYVALVEEMAQQHAWRGYDRRNIQWNFAVTCNENEYTGSNGLFILDIDNKVPNEDPTNYYINAKGEMPMGDELLEYVAERIPIDDCPMSRTPSGGYHLYFRADGVDWSGYKQDQRMRGPDGKLLLDGRNPSKGCCCEWPSPGYKWIRPLRPIASLPSVPKALLDWLPVNEKNASRESHSASHGFMSRGLLYDDMDRIDVAVTKREKAILYETLCFIQDDPRCSMREGERNHNLLRVCNIAYWGGGLSERLTRVIAKEWSKDAGFNDEKAIERRIQATMEWLPPSGFKGFIRRRLGVE